MHVAGLGITPQCDIPAQAQQWIDQSSRIFTLEPEHFYAEALSAHLDKIENLQPLFDQHPLRRDALMVASEQAVRTAETQDGVLFLLGGHPTLAAIPATYIRDLCAERKVNLVVQSTSSSVDHLLAYLCFDPTEDGIQIVRGSAISHVTHEMPSIVMCPGYAEDVSRTKRLSEIAKLVSGLRQTYGSDAEYLLFSQTALGPQARIHNLSALLEDLATRQYLGDVILYGPYATLPQSVKDKIEGS